MLNVIDAKLHGFTVLVDDVTTQTEHLLQCKFTTLLIEINEVIKVESDSETSEGCHDCNMITISILEYINSSVWRQKGLSIFLKQ